MIQSGFDDGQTIHQFDSLLRMSTGLMLYGVNRHTERNKKTITPERRAAEEELDTHLVFGAIESALKMHLDSQVHRRSCWQTRHNALAMLISFAFELLAIRDETPQCMMAWDHGIGTLVTDWMHALLSNIGESGIFVVHLKRDLDIRYQIVNLNEEQMKHFPGMGGVMRVFERIISQED